MIVMNLLRKEERQMSLSYQQIKDGLMSNDPEVFRYLYRLLGGMIVGYVRKNNGTERDAYEMVHTVLMEFWLAVREGRYDEQGKLERYIYTLTANTWRDELRRRKVRRSEPLDPRLHEASDNSKEEILRAIVKDKRLEALQHCLGMLGEPCKEIIRLYHLESVSLQDVAARLGYDYNNLRKRIFDCKRKHKKLADDYLSKNTESSILSEY